MSLPDRIYSSLRDKGFSGAIPDMMVSNMRSLGATGNIQDMFQQRGGKEAYLEFDLGIQLGAPEATPYVLAPVGNDGSDIYFEKAATGHGEFQGWTIAYFYQGDPQPSGLRGDFAISLGSVSSPAGQNEYASVTMLQSNTGNNIIQTNVLGNTPTTYKSENISLTGGQGLGLMHVLVSCEYIGTSARLWVAVNGVLEKTYIESLGTSVRPSVSDVIVRVGRATKSALSSYRLNGAVTDVLVLDQFYDLSIQSNIDQFIGAGLTPIDPRPDGSTYIGSQPNVFAGAEMTAADWNSGNWLGTLTNFNKIGGGSWQPDIFV